MSIRIGNFQCKVPPEKRETFLKMASDWRLLVVVLGWKNLVAFLDESGPRLPGKKRLRRKRLKRMLRMQLIADLCESGMEIQWRSAT